MLKRRHLLPHPTRFFCHVVSTTRREIGDWDDDTTRALLWRLLLGVLPRTAPPSAWATEMANKREEYRRLKADHRVDIAKVRGEQWSKYSGGCSSLCGL